MRLKFRGRAFLKAFSAVDSILIVFAKLLSHCQVMAANDDSFTGLRDLHQDLLDLEQGHLRNIDRLWGDLEARLDELRQLLDKPSKNEGSRKSLLSGTTVPNPL